jgi:hypothetical protein
MEGTIDPRWRKASYSGNGGGSCVETGNTPQHVVVRDSKQDGRGPVLRFGPAAWRAFTRSLKS